MEPIKFLKLQGDVKLPLRATEQSAGLDLHAYLKKPITLNRGDIVLVPTGLAAQLEKGTVGYIFARSSLATKHGITLPNAVGVIDSDYRGEIKVALTNLKKEPFTIENGDRIAQFVVSPVLLGQPVEVSFIENTERGEGGFGSTGKR